METLLLKQNLGMQISMQMMVLQVIQNRVIALKHFRLLNVKTKVLNAVNNARLFSETKQTKKMQR